MFTLSTCLLTISVHGEFLITCWSDATSFMSVAVYVHDQRQISFVHLIAFFFPPKFISICTVGSII